MSYYRNNLKNKEILLSLKILYYASNSHNWKKQKSVVPLGIQYESSGHDVVFFYKFKYFPAIVRKVWFPKISFVLIVDSFLLCIIYQKLYLRTLRLFVHHALHTKAKQVYFKITITIMMVFWTFSCVFFSFIDNHFEYVVSYLFCFCIHTGDVCGICVWEVMNDFCLSQRIWLLIIESI